MKLTPTQLKCLRIARDRFVFPGRRASTFDSLERRGLVEGELRLHTTRPGSADFKRAYRTTDAGRKALAEGTSE